MVLQAMVGVLVGGGLGNKHIWENSFPSYFSELNLFEGLFKMNSS